MIKTEFVDIFMKNANLETKTEAKRMVDVFLDSLKESFLQDETLIFRGFGTFTVREFKKQIGVNPRTGEKVKIVPKKYIKFKIAKDLKEKLNSKRNKKR